MNWRRFFRRDRKQEELEAEIESYLSITIDENIAKGMSLEDAALAGHLVGRAPAALCHPHLERRGDAAGQGRPPRMCEVRG